MNQEISRSDYSQSEKLNQIGSYLQEVRQEQGLSVEQVATKTMIQARLLKAIESGNLDGLPEAIYVRGFIKRYAEFLGLNGNEIAKSFPLYSDSHNIEPTWQNSDVAQLRQTHLYLAYVALITVAVIGLGAVLTRLSSGDRPAPNPTVVEAPESETSPSASSTTDEPSAAPEESPAPEPPVEQPEPAPVEAPPEPIAENEPVNEPIEDASADLDEPSDLSDILQPTGLDDDLLATTLDPSVANKPIRVDVELQDQSWVRVLVDGKQEFEGILQEGDQRTWAAENDVVIRAGNAGGVLAIFNGTDPEPMGDPGAVSERRFSLDDIGTAQRAGQ